MQLQHFERQTGRLKLAGLTNGITSGRPIIALHGWLDNAASFVPLSPYLSIDRPFYALELPGHGYSEHRPRSAQYHMVDNALDVIAFVDAISEGCEFDLIGHSLGGIVATLVAASVPERVQRLVLLDSLGPLTDDIENVLPQLKKAVKRAVALRNSKLNVYPNRETAARARLAGVGKISIDAARILVDRGTVPVDPEQANGEVIWSSDPRLLEPSLVRFSEQQVSVIMGGIECPVQLITGESGYFRQYEAISNRLGYIKQIEHLQVEGGHHFHMDGDVQKTAEIVNAFLER